MIDIEPSEYLEILMNQLLIMKLRREFLQRGGTNTLDPHIAGTMYYSRIVMPVMRYGPEGQFLPDGVEPYWDGTAWSQRPLTRPDGQPHNDDWGQMLTDAVQTPHSAGTVISYTFTCPAGYEIKLHEIYTLASRAPDVAHRARLYRPDAGGTGRNTGLFFNVTTAVSGYWPNSDESAASNSKATVEGIILRAGDYIFFDITNNSIAGDTLDTIITYQQRAIP